jgi:ATP-dependent RNA helicase DDX19/DBP5
LLFSATFPPDVKDFATKLIKGPINTIYVKSDEALVLDVITQLWIDLRPEHRADARISLLKDLYDLLEMGQSIIFCRTRNEADIIQETLTQSGFKCSNLHSGLKGLDRDECMEAFRVGKNKVLITTNVLARGVDIPAVSLVVNYDMPVTHERPPEPDSETYLHRIGRTGRFGRKGLAINLIHDQESYQILKSIERHFSPEVEMITEAPADIEALEELLAAKMK